MSLKEFFKFLNKSYSRKNKCVKFYAQVNTFSYEIHDSNKTCFTKQSLIKESETYDFWINDKEVRKQIISDIKADFKA